MCNIVTPVAAIFDLQLFLHIFSAYFWINYIFSSNQLALCYDLQGTFLYKPVSVDDDGGELLVMDILRDEEDISKHVEDEAEIMILRNAIKKLSSRDQTIIKLLFGLENTEKKSQEEVASYFKVTQSLISRRKARSLRRLRTEMERYM